MTFNHVDVIIFRKLNYIGSEIIHNYSIFKTDSYTAIRPKNQGTNILASQVQVGAEILNDTSNFATRVHQ